MAEKTKKTLEDDKLLRVKMERVRLLEEKLRLKEGLPHLYGLKLYKWQEDYKKAKFKKKRLLCAANQIGKSTGQIIDRIDIATNPEIWPKLWPAQFKVNPNSKPYSWYLYPNQDTVTDEIENKWIPYYLPRGEFEDHEIYGWKIVRKNKVVKYIEFNSGYRIYFKTYNQDVHDLQSGTVWAIDCDEELPEHLLPELQARLFASDGYFSMAFTATIGQEFWKKVIEGVRAGEEQPWADAWKVQISMFDCMHYADGTPSTWTRQRIEQVIMNCKSKAEVKRRVYGKFIRDEGLKYEAFDRDRNYTEFPRQSNGRMYKGVPKGWSVYSGVDIGSGGKHGHPSAYSFLAVSPDLTKIRWIRGRRLDGIKTTAGDAYQYYCQSRGKIIPVRQAYDYACADFGNIAGTSDSWERAKKDHTLGEFALNTALKTGMFKIYYDPDDPNDESIKLVDEFESLGHNTNKKVAKDDFIDSVRYAITQIPIDWQEVFEGKTPTQKRENAKPGSPERERPNDYIRSKEEEQAEIDYVQNEIDEWAELY
jgi:hypothetical protein